MSSDPPTALPYASPPQRDAALPPAVRVGAIVYAAAILARHATYWSRSMLLGSRPNVAALLALAEMATLVVLLTLIVGRSKSVGGIVACAIVLLVILGVNLCVDLLTNIRISVQNALLIAWLIATRAQFCAIPVMLLVAASRGPRGTSR